MQSPIGGLQSSSVALRSVCFCPSPLSWQCFRAACAPPPPCSPPESVARWDAGIIMTHHTPPPVRAKELGMWGSPHPLSFQYGIAVGVQMKGSKCFRKLLAFHLFQFRVVWGFLRGNAFSLLICHLFLSCKYAWASKLGLLFIGSLQSTRDGNPQYLCGWGSPTPPPPPFPCFRRRWVSCITFLGTFGT